ncbi:cytochrome P450 [Mycobacterium sp. GA-2829]|uniref:cytochrome P450 n=1 Tax=Mycobacterium sp. GA-2829 TaxID=1772283 RepID=UPI00073FBD13|nr:cytochrome P450 [Mycobacterium sp. GA-2829]KUI35756.1 cytochrome [Mycobacterium sp. GA-2829]
MSELPTALLSAAAAAVDPVKFFTGKATSQGPFALHFPGLGRVVFHGTSAAARDILTAPSHGCRAPLPNPIEPVVGPASLILLSGEHHRRERALLTPALHGEQVKSYTDVIAEAAAAQIDLLRPGGTVDAYDLGVDITLDVAVRVVFGVADPARRQRYTEAVKALLAANTAPLMLLPALRRDLAGVGPWAKLLRLRDDLDRLLSEDMATRRAPGCSGGDMLDLLLSATDETGRGRTDAETLDQLRTLLAAGHETTASSVAWALFHIHRDDAVRGRVLTELSGAATPLDLVALPYLGAVVKETLRMHPPVPIVLRRLTEPLTVAGVTHPAGRVVGVALHALHFNPEIWSAPDRFDPDRFLARRPTPFEYAPFGGGYRRCIGAAFATAELAVALGTILARLDLRMPERDRLAPSPRSVARGIAVAPAKRITLEVDGLRANGISRR